MNVRSSPRMGLGTVSVLVALALVSSMLSAIPAAVAATPAGDCGSSGTFPSNCPAAVYSTVGTISTTGLSTANSGDLVIAIVVAQHGDSISTPTVGGTNMDGPVCTYAPSTGQVEVWYLYESSSISNQVVSVAVSGKSSDGVGLIAFGASGLSSSAATDGTCSTGSSTNASPSVTLQGLAYSNDIIIGGVLVSGSGSGVSSIAATSPTTLITSGTGSGGAKGGNAAGYQPGSSQTSQTVAFSISGGVTSWDEVAVALEASSTTPIPFFPQGAIPVIVATLGVYLLMRKRLQRRAEARVV